MLSFFFDHVSKYSNPTAKVVLTHVSNYTNRIVKVVLTRVSKYINGTVLAYVSNYSKKQLQLFWHMSRTISIERFQTHRQMESTCEQQCHDGKDTITIHRFHRNTLACQGFHRKTVACLP